MRIALASTELYPLSGGGIGQFASGAARVLSRVAEVTLLTSSANEPEYERLRASSVSGSMIIPPAPAFEVALLASKSRPGAVFYSGPTGPCRAGGWMNPAVERPVSAG